MGVIAKYKFNNTLADLLPEFNSGFTSDLYTVADEVDGDITTRTIESDSLPTLMRFGSNLDTYVEGNELALLEVLDMNTSGLISCYRMFRYCRNLTGITCEWDTSNVTGMQGMFSTCTNLTSLDVSNFNTSKVTTMNSMFRNCTNLTSLDVSNFDTSNVTDMNNTFAYCNNIRSLNLSKWITNRVTNMNGIVWNCHELSSLDISNFNMENYSEVTSLTLSSNIKYLKCNIINTLNKIKLQLPTRTSDNPGTIICKSDTTDLDTTTLESKYWNVTSETTLITKYVFDKSIHNNCIPEFNTEFEGYFIEDEVVEGSNEVVRVIESCGMLPTNLKFGYYTGSKLTREEAKSLMSVEYINTSNMNNTYTYCMFSHCNNLTTLDVSNFNTSNVITMYAMFYNCTNLTSLDVSSWDTSNVTNMRDMFYACNNLTSLDLSNFNTSNVTNMNGMFNICTNLSSLDLSNWDTSNVTNMTYIFNSCSNLTSLDLSNFNTSNVTNMNSMFTNTSLLTDIGVLYMDKSSLQKLVNAMPTDSNKTLWYKDVDIDGVTHGNNITLKKYIEENVEIVLNSPLLEGDTIEVVDGKLCHYHKMGMVVFDGSVKINAFSTNTNGINFIQVNGFGKGISDREGYCDNRIVISGNQYNLTNTNQVVLHNNAEYSYCIYLSVESSTNTEALQELQQKPSVLVYELTEPYYEDITPLQSSIALRTFEECNVQIITALPIKIKITYRTNITSAIVMEQELDTLDSGVNLSNLIEEEVDE